MKQANDAYSAAKAFELRSFSIDPSLPWSTRRAIKFTLHWGKGTLRSLLAPPLPIDTADDDGHARALVRGTSAHK